MRVYTLPALGLEQVMSSRPLSNNRSQSGLVADYLAVANGMVVMIAVFEMNTVKAGSCQSFPMVVTHLSAECSSQNREFREG